MRVVEKEKELDEKIKSLDQYKKCEKCKNYRNLLITKCQRYVCRSCFENSPYNHPGNNFNDLCLLCYRKRFYTFGYSSLGYCQAISHLENQPGNIKKYCKKSIESVWKWLGFSRKDPLK